MLGPHEQWQGLVLSNSCPFSGLLVEQSCPKPLSYRNRVSNTPSIPMGEAMAMAKSRSSHSESCDAGQEHCCFPFGKLGLRVASTDKGSVGWLDLMGAEEA